MCGAFAVLQQGCISWRHLRGSELIRTFLMEMYAKRVRACVECLLLALLSFSLVRGHTTNRPSANPVEGSGAGANVRSLKSVLENTVSPAFGATIIIIITVIVSGSAYLCFLKYVCTGCCKATQVAPVTHLDPNKSEEQV
ncbi:hypothetical protein DPEC_G00137900 [Dallia pectoralis]|uniref:Uncharacterized protein n=1 Tax=Dallia pectoralis TaxID=75939 RepID=A0ACC2GLV5_DALPE|nr:hypothetical protein DPEC_G00137900 [Dallia pectoralis]